MIEDEELRQRRVRRQKVSTALTFLMAALYGVAMAGLRGAVLTVFVALCAFLEGRGWGDL